MRLRRRAAGLLAGAGLLYLIGTNAQAGWLFVLAVLVLGAAAAGAALPLAGVRRLEVDVAAPPETRQGAPTSVTLRIANRGRGTRWAIVAHDGFLGGASSWVGAIRPGEAVTVGTVRDAPRRGEAQPGWVELRTSAPFGVAERRRRFPVEGSTLVLPRTVPIGAVDLVETFTTRERSTRREPRRGGGPEYLGVREYRAGDPIRHIHWRLTARHGQLVVRDLEEERVARVAVWLDTSSDEGDLDRACTVAASIVDAATETGAGVRLLAAGPDGPIGATRSRAIDLHRWLARLVAGDTDPRTALAGVEPGSLAGVGTFVVVVGARSAGQLEGEIARLGRTVPRVVVIVPVEAEGDAHDVVTPQVPEVEVRPWTDADGLGPPVVRSVDALV